MPKTANSPRNPTADEDKSRILQSHQNGNSMVKKQIYTLAPVEQKISPDRHKSHQNGNGLVKKQSWTSVEQESGLERPKSPHKNGNSGYIEERTSDLIHTREKEDDQSKKMVRWGYYDKNDSESILVDDWTSVYPVGSRQSPINLCTQNQNVSTVIKYNKRLNLHYLPGDVSKVINTGTGVKFCASGKSHITGGPLCDQIYKLEQFHFHWGSTNAEGSEHLLNDKIFAAELHLVHFNTKYQDFATAVEQPDGLCVVGVFIGAQQNANEKFNPVTEMLKKVVPYKTEEKFSTSDFNPRDMLPDDDQHFSFYPGSLTTPPLKESVLWINMLEPVDLSNAQLTLFRQLTNPSGKKIVNNYRPVQELNDRKIMHHYTKIGHK